MPFDDADFTYALRWRNARHNADDVITPRCRCLRAILMPRYQRASATRYAADDIRR